MCRRTQSELMEHRNDNRSLKVEYLAILSPQRVDHVHGIDYNFPVGWYYLRRIR